MEPTHATEPPPDVAPAPGRGDRGYVMAMAGLIMVPLLLFAGFATDLGSWYQTASRAQRAADAAALAGVVWLPDENAAVAAAREAAARNGFVDGVDGAQVNVERVGGEQLRVTVEAPVAQFFTQLVMDSFDVRRAATAEYVLPVPLGSPTNTLGTGNLGNGENFWLAVSGYCASKENGDLLLPISDANYSSPSNPASGATYSRCQGGNTVANTDYDSRGYWYAVNLATDSLYDVEVQVYDGSRRRCEPAGAPNAGRGCQNSNPNFWVGDSADGETNWSPGGLWGGSWTGGRATATTFVLHDRVVGFDYRATPTLATLFAGNNAPTFQGTWRTVGVLSRPERGIYPLQVFTAANGTGRASNQFAIRAVPVGAPSTTCSTIVGAADYLDSCPQVHGLEWMSIMANLTDAASGTGQASFYLAEVSDKHEGKTMEISLWDPGEGAQSIEILAPDGTPATFEWAVDCTGVVAPAGGCQGGPTTLLDVSGQNLPQPAGYRGSTSRYSDRMVRILVDLPADFSVFGTQRWWQVRYTVANSPTDRTTWSVRILGDPVHLIPNF